jgi:hypothetical protein
MVFRAWLVPAIVFLTFAPKSHAQSVSPDMQNYVSKYRQLFSSAKYLDYVAAHGEEDPESKAAVTGLVKHMNDQLIRDAQLGDSPVGDERIFLMTHLVHVLRFELAVHPRPAADETVKKFAACSKRLNDSLNKGSFQGWNDDREPGGQCMGIPNDAPTKDASKAVVTYINSLIASDENLPKDAAAGAGKAGVQ